LSHSSFESNEIHHVLDWMNDPGFDLKNLKNSLSYDKALAKSNRWVDLENQKIGLTSFKDIEGKDIELVYTTSQGYELVKLLSQDSKRREGKKMHNCLGRYHLNNPNLYSLRKNGIRVCSLDVVDGNPREIKGPCNKKVQDTHHAAAKECLDRYFKVNYIKVYDLPNIGLSRVRVLLAADTKGYAQSGFIDVVVNKESPFYNKVNVSIENCLNSVRISETAAKIEQALSLFSQDPLAKERVENILKGSLTSDYIICPFTKRYFKKNGVEDAAITSLKSVEGNFSHQFNDLLNVSFFEKINEKLDQAPNDYNKPIIEFISEYLNSDERKRKEQNLSKKDRSEWRSFLISLGNSFGFENHPSHYQSFFKITEKIPPTLEYILKDFYETIGLGELGSLLKDLKKVLNWQEITVNDYNLDEKVKLANSCDCEIERATEEQKTALEELALTRNTLNDYAKEYNARLEEISGIAFELVQNYSALGLDILKNMSLFNLKDSTIDSGSMGYYKNLLVSLNQSCSKINENNKSIDEGLLNGSLQSLERLFSLIRAEEVEIRSRIKSFKNVKYWYCPEECDGRSIVLENDEKIEPELSVYYERYQVEEMWIVKDAYSELARILADSRNIKECFFNYFKSHGINELKI
jgi:hypothetical protein